MRQEFRNILYGLVIAGAILLVLWFFSGGCKKPPKKQQPQVAVKVESSIGHMRRIDVPGCYCYMLEFEEDTSEAVKEVYHYMDSVAKEQWHP